MSTVANDRLETTGAWDRYRRRAAIAVAASGLLALALAPGCWCAGEQDEPITPRTSPARETTAPTPPSPAPAPMRREPGASAPPESGSAARRSEDGSLLSRIESLSGQSGAEAMELFRAGLQDRDPEVREAAIDALEWSGSAEADRMLASYLASERDEELQIRAIEAIEETAGSDGIAAVGGLLENPDASLDVKETSIDVLESVGSTAAAKALARGLRDPDPDVRADVADALDFVEDPAVADDLWTAFRSESDPEVRDVLLDALETLGEDVERYRD